MALLDFQSAHVTTILIAAIAALSVGVYVVQQISLYSRRQRFAKEHGCEPLLNKVPNRDPILGLDSMFDVIKKAKEHKLLESGADRFRQCGNTLSNHLLGEKIIITCEPQNIKTILSLNFKDYSLGLRKDSLGPLLGTGIFNSDGESWSHSRSMIRPNFNKDQVADIDAFERHMQDFLRLIPRDGSTVDLQELFFRYTIDSATEFLFGRSVHSLREAKSGATMDSNFAKAFNVAQDKASQRVRMGRLRFLSRDPEAIRTNRVCHEYVDQFVDDAVRHREDLESGKGVEPDKYVFLYELAKATKDKKVLRDELLNVLLAGRDTTASLLSNMWFVFANRPDIYAKLRQEVQETLQGEMPTYEQLRNMKYLKWCLNESLRLHPVVPGNGRLAINDTVLPLGGGPKGTAPIFVPKNTIVVYSPWSMHRREDLFGPDAAEFKPERWESLRPGWEYLPFNGGPRICLGQQYALTEAGYVTTRLVQEFSRVESRDPEPWKESLTLTLCSLNGTKVALTE